MYQHMVDGRCPVCDTADAACGPGAPTDPVITSDWGEVTPMQGGPLKVYDVQLGSTTVQMKLNESDARRYGVWQEPTPPPKPKRRTAKNKKLDIEPEATGGE